MMMARDALTEEMVLGMKVVELRKALRARGLSTSGRKAELQERLREHMQAAAEGEEEEAEEQDDDDDDDDQDDGAKEPDAEEAEADGEKQENQESEQPNEQLEPQETVKKEKQEQKEEQEGDNDDDDDGAKEPDAEEAETEANGEKQDSEQTDQQTEPPETAKKEQQEATAEPAAPPQQQAPAEETQPQTETDPEPEPESEVQLKPASPTEPASQRTVHIEKFVRPFHKDEFRTWLLARMAGTGTGTGTGAAVEPEALEEMYVHPLCTHCVLTFRSRVLAQACCAAIQRAADEKQSFPQHNKNTLHTRWVQYHARDAAAAELRDAALHKVRQLKRARSTDNTQASAEAEADKGHNKSEDEDARPAAKRARSSNAVWCTDPDALAHFRVTHTQPALYWAPAADELVAKRRVRASLARRGGRGAGGPRRR